MDEGVRKWMRRALVGTTGPVDELVFLAASVDSPNPPTLSSPPLAGKGVYGVAEWMSSQDGSVEIYSCFSKIK